MGAGADIDLRVIVWGWGYGRIVEEAEGGAGGAGKGEMPVVEVGWELNVQAEAEECEEFEAKGVGLGEEVGNCKFVRGEGGGEWLLEFVVLVEFADVEGSGVWVNGERGKEGGGTDSLKSPIWKYIISFGSVRRFSKAALLFVSLNPEFRYAWQPNHDSISVTFRL